MISLIPPRLRLVPIQRFILALASLVALFGAATTARADQYSDAVQQQLNALFPDKNYTVARAPSTALMVATDAAIAADASPSANAFHYVGSVLPLRTDSSNIAA